MVLDGEKTVGVQVCRAEVGWVVGNMHADIAQCGVGRSLGPEASVRRQKHVPGTQTRVVWVVLGWQDR